MNKRELLAQLKAVEVLKTNQAQAAMFTSVKREVHSAEVKLIAEIIELVENCLDELEKVKVPKFVADWLEACKKYGFITDLLDGTLGINDEPDEKLISWLNDKENQEVLARAWLEGYEVEEESKYRVNIGGLYLREPLGDTNDFTIRMTWNEDYAYPFDSWNMAREHISKLGGTIEKI